MFVFVACAATEPRLIFNSPGSPPSLERDVLMPVSCMWKFPGGLDSGEPEEKVNPVQVGFSY
jgi:hypothetical protein